VTALIWIRLAAASGARGIAPAVHAGRAPIAQGQGDVRIRGLVLRSPTSAPETAVVCFRYVRQI
jgi:hypothetical protein